MKDKEEYLTYVNFNGHSGKIIHGENIKTIKKNGVGDYTIVLKKPLGKKPSIFAGIKSWLKR